MIHTRASSYMYMPDLCGSEWGSQKIYIDMHCVDFAKNNHGILCLP